VKLSPWILLILISILAISLKMPFLHKTIFYPMLAYVLFYLAYIPKGLLLKFNHIGDYSYGTYILAYPIQQSIVHWYPGIATAELFLSSLSATLILAALSWHFIESKALRLKMSI
jgi:peptidoglycan/LPS O-acetylase OafA/YrhL